MVDPPALLRNLPGRVAGNRAPIVVGPLRNGPASAEPAVAGSRVSTRRQGRISRSASTGPRGVREAELTCKPFLEISDLFEPHRFPDSAIAAERGPICLGNRNSCRADTSRGASRDGLLGQELRNSSFVIGLRHRNLSWLLSAEGFRPEILRKGCRHFIEHSGRVAGQRAARLRPCACYGVNAFSTASKSSGGRTGFNMRRNRARSALRKRWR